MQDEIDPLEVATELMGAGRYADAANFLRLLLKSGRGGPLARSFLTNALLRAGDIPAALEAAREAVSLNPADSWSVVLLGDALLAAGHLPTAIGEYQRAVRLDPESNSARERLGIAWLEAGEGEKALAEFERIDHEGAEEIIELMDRAKAIRSRPRSDPGYVRHLFDQFSADYDSRMRGQLTYQAPEILRELAGLVMPMAQRLTVLDLGCGTGLAAEAFADMTDTIDGIDLSPAMIEKARSRRRYRNLAVADIETALANGGADYDLVLAADTLVYLGDLAATFAGVTRRLKPGGFFLFTVETSSGPDFELGPKRRWRHSESYLRKIAPGLELAGLVACAPRTEANVPVDGLAAAFCKPQ